MASLANVQKRASMAALRERAGRAVLKKSDGGPGAPAHVRALVGGVDNPKDRLATLQKFYPDAFSIGNDNFLFTSPETGELSFYNAPGLDVGDVASVTREGAQAVGGTLGAIGGAVVGGPPGAIAGSGVGTAAGEEVFNVGARLLGMEDTRTLAEHAGDIGTIGTVGGLGGLTGAGGGAAARGGTKALFRGGEAGRREAASAIEDMARVGAAPSVAQATKQPLFDSLETFLSRTPGGSGRIRKAVDATNKRVADGIDRMAKRLAGTGRLEPELAGRAVQRGLSGPGGFAERFKAKGGALYDKLDEFIPGEQQIAIPNTRAALAEMTELVPEIPALNDILVSPGLRGLAAAVPDAPLAYSVLKRVRSAIGKKTSSFDLVSDLPKAEMKALYAAITRDMETAALAAGPAATKALSRANKYWHAGMTRIEDILEPLINNKVPEQVFDALELGGRKGATKLRTLRRSLRPEEWRLVSGTVITRLGRAVPGQQGAEGAEFSFGTFLTNWNRLDKGAKQALFDGPGLSGIRSDLDAIARAAARIRESSKAFANPSGTAQGLIGQAMILGGAASGLAGAAVGSASLLAFPAMLVMVSLGANASARLMTSKSFVRWLAASTKVKPNGFGAHIGRLSAVAAVSDRETKDAIQEYLGILGEASQATTERPSGVAADKN